MQTARIPLIAPGTPLRMMAVVIDRFSNEILQDAIAMIGDISPTWLHSWDGEATMRRLVQDLDLYIGILENGNDDRVRALATSTLREISTIFRRDHAHGLVEIGEHDATLLSSPDLYQSLS